MLSLAVLSLILTLGITDALENSELPPNEIKLKSSSLGLSYYVKSKGADKNWPEYIKVKIYCRIGKGDYGNVNGEYSTRLNKSSNIITGSIDIHGQAVLKMKISELARLHCSEQVRMEKHYQKSKEQVLI